MLVDRAKGVGELPLGNYEPEFIVIILSIDRLINGDFRIFYCISKVLIIDLIMNSEKQTL